MAGQANVGNWTPPDTAGFCFGQKLWISMKKPVERAGHMCYNVNDEVHWTEGTILIRQPLTF